MNFTIFSTVTGELLRTGDAPPNMVDVQARENEVVVKETYQEFQHYWKDGEVKSYTAAQSNAKRTRPDWAGEWSNDTMSWTDNRSLEEIKVMKNAEINAARLAANNSGFNFEGKLIATDELSRSDIDGVNGMVSLIGALPPSWPGAWKAVDNSYVPITSVAKWVQFYGAMVAQGTANFAHAQALKAQLDAATTPEQANAVKW